VDAYSIPIEKLEKLQDSLRILSFIWLLKPLDLIQAYRLEMGKKFVEEQKIYMSFGKESDKCAK
jgi:cytoplasmic iron level regulating protein YaaA (DUF328/UPF0246 family)